jgi:hypothetical protein
MAIALVQTTSTGVSGTTTLAFSSNVTAGSCLVAVMCTTYVGGSPTASDNRNGAYIVPSAGMSTSSSSPVYVIQIYYVLNAAAGATTVTVVSTGVVKSINIYEFSGVATSAAIDVSNNASAFAGGSISSTLTTTVTGEVGIAAGISWSSGGAASSVTATGWTNSSPSTLATSSYLLGLALGANTLAYTSGGGTACGDAYMTLKPALVVGGSKSCMMMGMGK